MCLIRFLCYVYLAKFLALFETGSSFSPLKEVAGRKRRSQPPPTTIIQPRAFMSIELGTNNLLTLPKINQQKMVDGAGIEPASFSYLLTLEAEGYKSSDLPLIYPSSLQNGICERTRTSNLTPIKRVLYQIALHIICYNFLSTISINSFFIVFLTICFSLRFNLFLCFFL